MKKIAETTEFLKDILFFAMEIVAKTCGFSVFFYFILYIISATFPLYIAYMLKVILDCVAVDNCNLRVVGSYVVIYASAIIAERIVEGIRNITERKIIERVGLEYEYRVLEHIACLPLEITDTVEGRNTVEETQRAKNTVTYIIPRVIIIISQIYFFCASAVIVFKFNILFATLFALLTIPGIIVRAVNDRELDRFRRKHAPDARRFSYYRWMLTDIYPARDVRLYDLTEPIKGRYFEEKREYCRANKIIDKKKLRWQLLTETIKRSGEIAFTGFVIWSALKKRISIGDAVMYVGLSASMTNSFENTVNLGVYFFNITTRCMKRVISFFEMKTERSLEKSNSLILDNFENLEFSNVTFTYPGSTEKVLDGVSFTIKKGEKIVLVGINGAGKSTIIKLMLGFYHSYDGEIKINGKAYEEYDLKSIRKTFSVLFQDFVKYPLTLRDNIVLSDITREINDNEVMDVLRKSGGYDEIIGKAKNLDAYMTHKFDDNGVELSKGQWQKLAVARAYYKKAEIVIFDEPSSALDADAEDKIFRNFEKITNNTTGIMISHRISSARIASRILVLDGGRIVENGTHAELIANNGLYAYLFNLQKNNYT